MHGNFYSNVTFVWNMGKKNTGTRNTERHKWKFPWDHRMVVFPLKFLFFMNLTTTLKNFHRVHFFFLKRYRKLSLKFSKIPMFFLCFFFLCSSVWWVDPSRQLARDSTFGAVHARAHASGSPVLSIVRRFHPPQAYSPRKAETKYSSTAGPPPPWILSPRAPKAEPNEPLISGRRSRFGRRRAE